MPTCLDLSPEKIWIFPDLNFRKLLKTFPLKWIIFFSKIWSPLVRRLPFWPPSMVYISVIITHILHITNHAGPSVWAAFHAEIVDTTLVVSRFSDILGLLPPWIETKPLKYPASQIPFASQIARASQIASMLPELDHSVFDIASFRSVDLSNG